MDYSRVTPRARNGTSGINDEFTLAGDNAAWIIPPDRIAAITVAVHIPTGATATYAIECSCNLPSTIGSNGQGGYWDSVEAEVATYTASTIKMLANAVTAIRVRCISFSAGTSGKTGIDVAFAG